MDGIARSLAQTEITVRQAILLVFLLGFLPLLVYFAARARAGRSPGLRPIRAFSLLHRWVGQAAETARPVHVSLGTGGIVDAGTTESLAGLTVLQDLSRHATAGGAPVVATVSDPTLLPLAQEVTSGAWQNRPLRLPSPMPETRLVAPVPAAYAAGTMDVIQHENLAGSVLIGRFGQEYLLMGEAAARAPAPLVAGAQNLDALPFMYATADETLIGEEIYASGAYLESRPTHIASLRAQDWMRVAIGLAILVGVALRTIGLWR